MTEITLTVHDEAGYPIAEIDNAEVLWTERYTTYGEWQVKLPANAKFIQLLKPQRYITKQPVSGVGIIETIEIKTDDYGYQVLTVSGRTAGSLMTRRIFNKTFELSGNAKTIIEALRVWHKNQSTTRDHNITFKYDTKIEALTDTMNTTSYGKTLSDAITEILTQINAGYTEELKDNVISLSFYIGADREDVVFSPEYDNLRTAQYLYDAQEATTAVYVAGEGDGENRTVEVVDTNKTGKERFERYIDARDLQKADDQTDADYKKALQSRGLEKVSLYGYQEAFTGEVSHTSQWTYGRDYTLGDRVKVEISDWGVSAMYRVVEITEQQTNAGYQLQPVFAK